MDQKKAAPNWRHYLFPSLHPRQGRHPPVCGQQATARPFCLRPRRLALVQTDNQGEAQGRCCRRRKHSAKGQGDSSSGPTTNPQNIQFSILVPRTFLLPPPETCKGRHTRPISTVASIPHGQYVRRKHGLPPTSTHNTRRARHRACLRFLSSSLRSSLRTRRPSRALGWAWCTTCKTRPGRRTHSRRGGDSHSRRDGGRNAWLFFAGFVLFSLWWVAAFGVPIPQTRRLGDQEEGGEKGTGAGHARSWRRRCRIMAGVSLVTCVPFIILLAVFLSR
ncbi:hypothetical protein B0H14DRAFT_2774994, partial [Mycena olivaceomarginata]